MIQQGEETPEVVNAIVVNEYKQAAKESLNRIIQTLNRFCYARGCSNHAQDLEFNLYAIKYNEAGQCSYIFLCQTHFQELNSGESAKLSLIEDFSIQNIEGRLKKRIFKVNRTITFTQALSMVMKNPCCCLMIKKYINLMRLKKYLVSYSLEDTLEYLKKQKLDELEQRKREYLDIIEGNKYKRDENKFYTVQYYKRLAKIKENRDLNLNAKIDQSCCLDQSDMFETRLNQSQYLNQEQD